MATVIFVQTHMMVKRRAHKQGMCETKVFRGVSVNLCVLVESKGRVPFEVNDQLCGLVHLLYRKGDSQRKRVNHERAYLFHGFQGG